MCSTSNLQPVPIGVPGELYVGGDGLARGYLNLPQLMAEKFIPNPFDNRAGARLYRTGDLVRYRSDGNIEFLGRLDRQVKIRGYRIEPSEVESILSRHPSVRQAVVVAREDSPRGPFLVAYILPNRGREPAPDALHSFVREQLPEYMVPSAFVMVDQLPLTPSGKLDRLALPALDTSRPAIRTAYAVPRTPIEETLAGVWAQILGIERIGVRDNFFEIGGHSLLATRVMSRVRDAFNVDLPLRAFFENPTIAQLAKLVEEARGRGEENRTQAIVPRADAGPAPLSYAQQRLWFLDQLMPGTNRFNLSSAHRIGGWVDPAVLESSLNEIVRRHEVLRTTFRAVNGEPFQIVAPTSWIALRLVDLSSKPVSQREAAALALASEEAKRPFDLERGPLLRTTLARMDKEAYIFLFTIHHIISDAWSTGVFWQELTQIWDAFAEGKPSPLPDLPIQYADFAVWQRNWLRGPVLEKQLAYWREQLAGMATLQLPTDRPRPEIQSTRGAALRVAIPPEVIAPVRTLGQLENSTLFMTLLAAFQTLLFRYTRQEDIVSGTFLANRNRGEIESLIGFFVNSMVLRTDFRGSLSFREVLRQVRKMSLDGYAHQDLPFARLVQELQPERDLSHNPLFQVAFQLLNAPSMASDEPDPDEPLLEGIRETAILDLTFTFWETGGGLDGEIEVQH